MSKTHLHNIQIAERGRTLKEGEIGSGPVVYWMSREQRVDDNWALLYAQKLSLELKKPLIVAFCITLDYPAANLRHYSFLLQGLEEVGAALGNTTTSARHRAILMVVRLKLLLD